MIIIKMNIDSEAKMSSCHDNDTNSIKVFMKFSLSND